MALTIGVDARAAHEERGGRGTLVRELLRALARSDTPHGFRLLAREPWQDAPRDPRLTWALTRLPDPAWNLAAAVRASRSCDVLLSTNSYLTAWATSIPTVVVVCDMVAFHPELLPQRRAALIERATLPLAVRRAAALAAISRATADDLAALQPRAAAKTVVTELAADARFAAGGAPDAEVLARHGLTGRSYVLGVGTLEPRKNLPRLIEAFAGLPAQLRAEHELVLVGALGWDTDATLRAVERHRTVVRTLGHVPGDDLPALYRGATAFAYPSLYEGFGLPVLEAMTAGTPVLTSRISSLPEVAGEAAVYVDPREVGSIRDGLAAMLADPARRAALAGAARARAGRFSWDRYAVETVAACERAVA